jgi:DNA-binding CsgD family transcriptional regulator
MIDDLVLGDVIGRIYDAALRREDWAVALESVAEVLGGDSSVVLERTGKPDQQDNAVRVRSDPAYAPLYGQYRNFSPFASMLPRLPSGSVFVDFMLVPESILLHNQYRVDYALPQGRYSSLVWTDIDQGGALAFLSVWRSRRRPAWDSGGIRLLRHLGPHLSRALALEQRLAAGGADGAPDPLSRRERDCLACIARGASSKAVARQLNLSAHTVSKYVESAMRKLGASNRSEAVVKALGRGLFSS